MFNSLLDMYLGMFQARGEPVLIAICNCSVPSQVVLQAYKKLPPIETMPEKEKAEMKKFINQTFPDKTVEQKVEAAKIFYTIGTIL